MRVLRAVKLVGATLVVLAGVVAVLIYAAGMRISVDGSGMWPLISFGSRDSHFDALERQRATQRAQRAPPSAATAPEAIAEPAPASAGATAIAPVAAAPGEETPHAATPTAAPSAAGSPLPTRAGAWSEFRGPRRDGVYAGTAFRLPWPQRGPSLLWKQPIGEGYASFSVGGTRAFTIEQRRKTEVVAAYHLETGRELWTHTWDAEFRESMGGDGPRATPTWHAGRVYALGAAGELRCLRDSDGSLIWRHDILGENNASNLQWGMSASPLVVDDKVVVLPGGPDGHSVVAYHKDTGAVLWRVLDDQQAYTAPMIATLLGTRQLVVVSATRAVGLSIGDGALLWEYAWPTQDGINASQPIFLSDSRVFLSSGYGQGSAVFEVSRSGEQWQARTVWETTRMKNRFASSVLLDGYVYGLDEGILACLDVTTGEMKWKGGRYGHGQLVRLDQHLVVLTERGELALVQATPAAFREIAVVPAIEGKTWNHPALADGRLLVRNAHEMAAFDLRPSR